MNLLEASHAAARWRREFHRHPELGFLEYRTAARVCAELTALTDCKLRVGQDVMLPSARMNVPSAEEHVRAREEACATGADPRWVERFGEGLTGVVAEWRFARPGPVVAFRFDIDALPVSECDDPSHRPTREGFASRFAGRMHACGHDAHTAMGLAFATMVRDVSAHWGGTLRLIFQPAEEGCRGAQSMVAAGVVDDVDWLICSHVGAAARRTGLIACASRDFLAATIFEVRFTGQSAHAGLEPQLGRNALLAAATCAVQLHALPRHAAGNSRVNVGALHAGTSTNIVPADASLKFEVRGETSEVNRFMAEEAKRTVHAAAALYGVKVELQVVGEAAGARCDEGLMRLVRQAAEHIGGVDEVVDALSTPGSEDATLLIEAVQARGGQGTYLLVGSKLAAGHHQDRFDFEDASLGIGVELLAAIADRLLGEVAP